MSSLPPIAALIVAAGRGVRFGGPVPKPVTTLAGKAVVAMSVEAMAAGNAIVAHDNDYNRWVAADGALYFRTEDDADAAITSLLEDRALRDRLSAAARDRNLAEFTWTHVAGQYEDLLVRVGGVSKPVNDTSTCTTGGHR